MKLAIPVMIGSIAGLVLANQASALTCPTSVKRDTKGFWYSTEKPGWKSKVNTTKNITVDTRKFGGVVYSPKYKRLACVYKTSHGKWIALVSEKSSHIMVDEKAKDDSGKAPAWKFSKQHGDYVCGRPNTTQLSKCVFELKKSNSSKRRHHRRHAHKTKKTWHHHAHANHINIRSLKINATDF